MTTSAWIFVLALAAAQSAPQSPPGQETPQEKPKIPKDSIELTVVGCLTGRALKTVSNRQADVESAPFVGERTFRLAGKKELMNEVKRQNGHLVEVVGVVKRSDLDERGIKAGRVTIAGGPPVASTHQIPSAADNVAVMDATSIRMRSSSCTAQ
jgi:hypothetical protein